MPSSLKDYYISGQVENYFFKMKGWNKGPQRKEQGHHFSQLKHPNQHDTILISLSDRTSQEQRYRDSVMFINVCLSCKMTPCSFLFGAFSHPYIPLHIEEMVFPLVWLSFTSVIHASSTHVVQCLPRWSYRSTVGTCNNEETIA